MTCCCCVCAPSPPPVAAVAVTSAAAVLVMVVEGVGAKGERSKAVRESCRVTTGPGREREGGRGEGRRVASLGVLELSLLLVLLLASGEEEEGGEGSG